MIQVAFAGHARPEDLGLHEPVAEAVARAFALVREAGVTEARLLAGLATGADQIAARAWTAEGLGPIHAVMPFLDAADEEERKLAEDLAEEVTWLDGAKVAEAGRNPYLKQTRFIVEAADLLIVVWTGAAAKGVGGTADAVLCAMEMGLPVIWIRPSEPETLRLILPDALPPDFHFPEFQYALENGFPGHVEDVSAARLAEALYVEPDEPEPPAPDPKSLRGRLAALLNRTIWRTYPTFRKLVGGQISGMDPGPETPPDLAGQPGFQTLTRAYGEADAVANRLSTIHRSEQILLVSAMIAAAVVGSAWVVWPDFKLTGVWIELGIVVATLLIWASGSDAQQHERWSQKRYLAEQLRLERAAWALGVGLAPALPPESRRLSGAWREAQRTAGLPGGVYDADRVKAWGAWSMHELIHGQSAYHHATSARDGRIAHRLHVLEDASFMFLFVTFAAYVAFAAVGVHPVHWIKGSIGMIGAIVPAIAAATMALEAKLEFQEQSARSGRMASMLDELADRLGPDPSFDALQTAARAAVRMHLAEASHWREGSGRRQLLRA